MDMRLMKTTEQTAVTDTITIFLVKERPNVFSVFGRYASVDNGFVFADRLFGTKAEARAYADRLIAKYNK